MKTVRKKIRKVMSLMLSVVMLVTSLSVSGFMTVETKAATAYYPVLSYNLGKLSDENTYLSKLSPNGIIESTSSMCSISMAGYSVFCMYKGGSLSRYNDFYTANVENAYGSSFRKYFKGAIYYFADENDEFTLDDTARYVVSQIMLWRILQIRAQDKSGTYANIMDGFESTFKSIINYWGEANANTAWNEIKTVMGWCNNGLDKVSSKVTLYLWTHADGTQPLLAGEVEPTTPKAYIKIHKTGEIGNANVKGAVYGIYSKKGCGEKSLICTLTTDNDGDAITTKTQAKQLKPSTTYYVKEIQPPQGSVIDKEVYKIQTSASETKKQAVKLTVTDKQYKIKLNTVKVDKNNKTMQLSGAVFRVYQWSVTNSKYEKYKDYTTGSDGDFTTEWLYYTKGNAGKWRIEEIKAPANYQLTGWKRDIQIDESNNGDTVKYTVENPPEPQYGWIEIYKKGFVGVKEISNEVDLSAWFTIYSDADCTKSVGTIKTGATGYGKSDKLPVGAYYVKETKWGILTPTVKTAQYAWVEHNKTTTIKGESGNIGCQTEPAIGLKLKKVDSEDESIPLESAEFGIYEYNGISWTLKYKEKTNSKGIIEIPTEDSKLYYTDTNKGKFKVVELTAPAGYTLDSTPRYITITKENEGTVIDLGVFKNTPIGGNLEIQKIITDASNNKITDMDMSSSQFDISYGLYTDAACTNQARDSIKLNSSGKAVIEDIRAGVYYLKETSANRNIFAATGTLSTRIIQVTINSGKTTMVDGELGYSEDGGETWIDCWSGAMVTSLAESVPMSAVDILLASNQTDTSTSFGSDKYTVVYESAENKTTINDVTDSWKELSDEELDDIIGNSEDADLAEFLINLSDDDLELILEKDTRLIQPYTIYELADEETGELEEAAEAVYWEYLMSLPYQPATMSTLTSKTGYFYLKITGDGKTTSVKINVTADGTNTTGNWVTTSYTATVSGKNNHNFALDGLNNYTSPAASSGEDANFNRMYVNFKYTKTAHYVSSGSISGNCSGLHWGWESYPWGGIYNNTMNNTGHNTSNVTECITACLHVTNAGLLKNNGTNYHATMTVNLSKQYGGLMVNPNGGSWKFGESTYSAKTYVIGHQCGWVSTIGNPTRTGYTFNGWSLTNGANSHATLTGNVYGSTITTGNSSFTFGGKSSTESGASASGYYATLTANWTPNKYTVTYIDVAGTDINGKELGRGTFKADYDSTTYGSAAGSSTILGAYYTGYYYNGCSSAKVGLSGTTVYRFFTKTPTPVNTPNVLKNILKGIELDIIKTDADDETKTLEATFDVQVWSDAENKYVDYLTNVNSQERIALNYSPDNTKGKFKIIEKTVESPYTMSGAEKEILLDDGVSIPYYENLLGVDEDMGVFVLGRGYNEGEIVRDNADADSAVWYQCLIANKDKKLTNTTYWQKVTASNYNRYNDLVNGAGDWNADLDVITSLAVQITDIRTSNQISIKKKNEQGEILPNTKFVAYYADDGTKFSDFTWNEDDNLYYSREFYFADEQTHATVTSGSYYDTYTLELIIKEEKAPDGYLPVDDIKVTITAVNPGGSFTVVNKIATMPDGSQQNIYSGNAIEVIDKDVKLNINLNKKSTDSSLPVSTLAGAVYGIYENEGCTSLATTATINENGTASVTGITLKDYWIKEISAPTSGLYRLSDEVKHISASELYDGNTGITVVNAYISVEEEPLYGEILLKKLGYTDSTYAQTINLAGAGFTIYRMPEIPDGEDENEYVQTYDFSNETPVMNEKLTDSDGLARFQDLTAGDYVLVETTVPSGFLKADNMIVHLTKEYLGNTDETAYPVITYDEPYTAPLKIYKVSARDNTQYLEGTVFKIFDVAAGGFIGETVYTYDEDGNIVETVEPKLYTTDENGEVITDSLNAGTYKIYEVSSTSGYRLNEEPVEIVIGEGKETGRDENGYPYYEVTIKNEPTDTYFTKCDITTKEEIPGGHYTVSDSLGNIIDEWDGTGEAHHIYGLIPGEEYTYSEETAPDGYVVAEDVRFTINEDGTPTEVVMYDDYNKVDFSKRDLTTGEELPGAVLQVLNLNGSIIEEWTSTDEPHRINRLPAGTYILREKTAPEGWIISEDIEFTVGESAEVQEVVMYDDYTRTAFNKLAEDTMEPLPGCVLQVKDLEGNVIDEWTTTEEAHYVYKLTKGETYILHEKTVVEGYELAEDIRFVAGEEFSNQGTVDDEIVDDEGIGIEDDSNIKEEEDTLVKMEGLTATDENADPDDGLDYSDTIIEDVPEDAEDDTFMASELVTVTMKDSPLEIIPEKVDENGNPVYNAEMQILDSNGNVVYEWTTGLMQTQGFKVVPGTYVIHEKSAPAGFQLAEDKEVTITNKDVYAKIEDHTMKVSVSKNDEEGNLLTDAVLQVIDESGIIVDEWTTTDSVHVITDLIAGKTYKLHEKAAPEGFMIADDVTFKTEGTDINVTMVDKKTDVTVKKVNPFGFGIDGAELQIIDSNGDVVKEFTSSAKGNNFKGLPKGEYTLHEKEAGEGFELAEDVKFTVGDESITVKMVDEFTNIKLPLTGGTPLNMLIFAIPLILLGAGMYIFGRRRKQTEK